MKRIISLLLVLIIAACTVGAFAEAPAAEETAPAAEVTETEENAEENAAEGFTFRNGITWGMNLDQVKAAEDREIKSCKTDGDVTALFYGLTDVSKYTADYVLYLFVNDQLVSATYIFSNNWDDDQYNYLTEALCELYGEKTEMSKEEITDEMDFYSGFDGSAIESAYGWNTDDAHIRIARDSEIDISYTAPDFTHETSYNTQGL